MNSGDSIPIFGAAEFRMEFWGQHQPPPWVSHHCMGKNLSNHKKNHQTGGLTDGGITLLSTSDAYLILCHTTLPFESEMVESKTPSKVFSSMIDKVWIVEVFRFAPPSS
jgi:hypothetical protein